MRPGSHADMVSSSCMSCHCQSVAGEGSCGAQPDASALGNAWRTRSLNERPHTGPTCCTKLGACVATQASQVHSTCEPEETFRKLGSPTVLQLIRIRCCIFRYSLPQPHPRPLQRRVCDDPMLGIRVLQPGSDLLRQPTAAGQHGYISRALQKVGCKV